MLVFEKSMANRSRSAPAHLFRLSISKESVHEDRHLQFEVHKENQGQPLQTYNRRFASHLQKKRSATNTTGPSQSNMDREMGMLREQVQ